jgi:hypothetical protein
VGGGSGVAVGSVVAVSTARVTVAVVSITGVPVATALSEEEPRLQAARPTARTSSGRPNRTDKTQ